MNKDTKTNTEGGTDLDGFQDFLINVDNSLFPGEQTQQPDIEINLGDDDKEPEKEEIEQEEVKKQPTEPTQPKEEEPQEEEPQQDQADSYYGKLASKFLEKGKWQDAEIEIEEGNVIKLSELKDIDEELFFQIQENQDSFKNEELKTNYISTKNLDDNKRKIIEIIKEGGDIKELFSTPQEMQRPFEGIDLDNDNVQKQILLNYLTQVKSLNEEDAKIVLGNHEKRGELDTKVTEIVSAYQKDYDKRIEDKLQQVKLEKEEKTKKDKENSKQLESIYKEYQIEDKLAKKLSTLGTKRTKEGEYELDNIYTQKLEDPQEAADLIFYLIDKEGFLKSKMSETRVKTQKENLKRISLIKDKTRKGEEKQTANEDNPFLIKLQ